MIETIEELEALYGRPKAPSLQKVATEITPGYRAYIEAAPFVALATVGPEGTDCTPRGDEGQVVFIEDKQTLALPDWRGNDRLDSLRNVVRADLWNVANAPSLPTAGDILHEMTSGEFAGKKYDETWPERAAKTLW